MNGSKCIRWFVIMSVLLLIAGCGTMPLATSNSAASMNSTTSFSNQDQQQPETNNSSSSTNAKIYTNNSSIPNNQVQSLPETKVNTTLSQNGPAVSEKNTPITPAAASMGQRVSVGPFQMEVPETASTPIIRTSDNNVFVYGNHIFIEIDISNSSNNPQTIGSGVFRLTWTPRGGNMHFYTPNTTEEYNVNTSTYKNGKYYFGSPFSHQVASGDTEKLDLIFDIPTDMSPNESGTIGLSADISRSNQQLFALAGLN